MKNTLKYTIAIVIGLSSFLYAKDIPSPFFVTIGADANGIMYSSDFRGFQGVENCCTSFSTALGIKYNLHGGIEYRSEMFGMPAALDLSFSWSDLSAGYHPRYEFANIITGNSYSKGISEFVLEPSIQAISIEPGIYLSPFDSFPLAFRFGFQAGILMGKTFNQQENLISPENAYFENGTKTRGVYSGSIPSAESLMYGISAGARMRAAKFGSISFYPEIRFNYGLSDLVSGLDWKTITIQAGVMVAFNIPGGRTAPPPNPPNPLFPDAPQPPPPSFVKIILEVGIDGVAKQNDSEFMYPFTEYVSEKRFSLLPVIFFRENSADKIDDIEESANNIGEAAVHKSLVKSVAQLMAEKPDVKVTLVSSSINTEPQAIIDSRINSVAGELQYYGIGINRINITKKQVKKEDFKEPLLSEENIFIRLELSDGTKLVPFTQTEQIRKQFKDVSINVKPEIITTSDLIKFNGNISGFNSLEFDAKGLSASLTPLVVRSNSGIELKDNLMITAEATNSDGTKAHTEFTLNLKAERKESVVSLNNLPQSNTKQFILCYFDYDRSEPKIINADVAALIKSAIANGKKVTFLAQTDNLGTEVYNSDLALKRGRKAMELFNGNSVNIDVIQPNYYVFSNMSPLGRMLNRTVIVRFDD